MRDKLLPILFFAFLFCFGCGNDDDGNGPIGVANLSFKIDGVEVESSMAWATVTRTSASQLVEIYGGDSKSFFPLPDIVLNIVLPANIDLEVDTYSRDYDCGIPNVTECLVITYYPASSEDDQFGSNLDNSATGFITIDEANLEIGGIIRGSFMGELESINGESVTITDGIFYVEVE